MISFKVYNAPYGNMKFYYMTIGGYQFGPVYFSEREVLEAIEKVKCPT